MQKCAAQAMLPPLRETEPRPPVVVIASRESLQHMQSDNCITGSSVVPSISTSPTGRTGHRGLLSLSISIVLPAIPASAASIHILLSSIWGHNQLNTDKQVELNLQ